MVAFLTPSPLLDGVVEFWEDMYFLSGLMSAGADRHELLSRQIEVLGLDPNEVVRTEPGIFVNLHRVCVQCDARAQCEADLNKKTPKNHRNAQAMPNYCPNAATLDMLSSLLSPD